MFFVAAKANSVTAKEYFGIAKELLSLPRSAFVNAQFVTIVNCFVTAKELFATAMGCCVTAKELFVTIMDYFNIAMALSWVLLLNIT